MSQDFEAKAREIVSPYDSALMIGNDRADLTAAIAAALSDAQTVLRDNILRLRSRVAELEARLEIDHHFEYIDGEMVRVDVDPAERKIGDCDGIGCRDATIALLEDYVLPKVEARVADLEAALAFYAAPPSWEAQGHSQIDADTAPILRDKGDRARSALSASNASKTSRSAPRTGEEAPDHPEVAK